jgi:H+-transporting ATPase
MSNVARLRPGRQSDALEADLATGRQAPAKAPEIPGTDLTKGLTSEAAVERLQENGPNELPEKTVSPLERLARYFWGPIPWMIEAAAILSAILGDWADFSIIATMLIVNAGVDFWQENKAGNAIALLKKRLALTAHVLRDGAWRTIPARELVPGDVVLLKLGSISPADMTLVKGDYLSADESALTGESLPVEKKLGETAYSGSIIKLGEMTGVVTATGPKTYFGKTAQLVESAENRSHFQRAVLKIGNFLILTTLVLVVLILFVSIFRDAPFLRTLQFALILTVAAIPVALPAVLSVTMAVGAEKLAQMKAIVSRLVAIEELAGVDVLCADKTGTLTKNQLTIENPRPAQGVKVADLMDAARLASNPNDSDAIDTAVLNAASTAATASEAEVKAFKPFDPVSKRTEAQIVQSGRTVTVSKGAPQVILDLVEPEAKTRTAIEAEVTKLAEDGYRAIGVARKMEGSAWQFLGLIPIFDPPRDDAAATIKQARGMGVGIKMITGDH